MSNVVVCTQVLKRVFSRLIVASTGYERLDACRRYAQGSDGSFKVDVAVSLDNGEVLTLDGTSFGAEVMDGGEVYYAENAADAVIDVETATIDVSVDDVKDK